MLRSLAHRIETLIPTEMGLMGHLVNKQIVKQIVKSQL